jgi:hypothetical protein
LERIKQVHDDAPLGVLESRTDVFCLTSLVAAAMHFQVLMIRYRILQPQYMLTGTRIKTVEQDRVCCLVVLSELEQRIIYYDVAIVLDSNFAANLKNDFHFVLRPLHVSAVNDNADSLGIIRADTHKRFSSIG